jgi:hypothetical protein
LHAWFYADYPYVVRHPEQLAPAIEPNWTLHTTPLTENNIQRWVAAVAAHLSQISTFWKDMTTLETAIRAYAADCGGGRLWRG